MIAPSLRAGLGAPGDGVALGGADGAAAGGADTSGAWPSDARGDPKGAWLTRETIAASAAASCAGSAGIGGEPPYTRGGGFVVAVSNAAGAGGPAVREGSPTGRLPLGGVALGGVALGGVAAG